MNNAQPQSIASDGTALPVILIVLPSRDPDVWEQQLVTRLRASCMCKLLVREIGASDKKKVAQEQSNPIIAPHRTQAVTAIVDITGQLGAAWQQHTIEGVWRICDSRGVVLGDEYHGLESITCGVGARLYLVASTETGTTLIDSAGAYVEPGETVPLERLSMFAETLLLAALREIRKLGGLEPRPQWKACGTRPSYVRRLVWKARERRNSVLRRLRHILLVEQWMLGIVDMPVPDALRLRHLPVRWIGDRKSSHYWADPFGIPGSENELYCEEYDHVRGIGRIVKLKLDGLTVQGRPEPIDFGLPGHLSYPYLFRHANALYCVVESSESRRCVLSRQDVDGRWTHVAVLLKDTEAADPTIFEHEGYFWLAYTDVSIGAFDNLCLCYAIDLLGPWHLHPQNPVKIDHCSARSAGAVVKDGDQLLRLAQVCKSGYGQAIAVNRVLHCTPELYREELIGILSPERDEMNPHGLHTVSRLGNRLLVDGKRYGVNWSVLGRKFASRFMRIRRSVTLFRDQAVDE